MAIPGTSGIHPALAARARPVSERREQLLPLHPAVAGAFPGGGLQRGAVVAVWSTPPGGPGAGGGTSLAFTLVAAASKAGWWCAAVGTCDVGVLALAELGVNLDRLVLVPRPRSRWAEVAGALFDGMDVVLVSPPGRVRATVARQLSARARDLRVALVVLCRRGSWPECPDLHLTMTGGRWEGTGKGDGHLQGRRVGVEVGGRRSATAVTQVEMWLPLPSGGCGPLQPGDDRH